MSYKEFCGHNSKLIYNIKFLVLALSYGFNCCDKSDGALSAGRFTWVLTNYTWFRFLPRVQVTEDHEEEEKEGLNEEEDYSFDLSCFLFGSGNEAEFFPLFVFPWPPPFDVRKKCRIVLALAGGQAPLSISVAEEVVPTAPRYTQLW